MRLWPMKVPILSGSARNVFQRIYGLLSKDLFLIKKIKMCWSIWSKLQIVIMQKISLHARFERCENLINKQWKIGKDHACRSTVFSYHDDPVNAVLDFIKEKQIDLLTVVSRNKGLFDKIFSPGLAQSSKLQNKNIIPFVRFLWTKVLKGNVKTFCQKFELKIKLYLCLVKNSHSRGGALRRATA